MAAHFGPWSGRKYLLNKMTLRELVVAYFTHHSILTYLVLIAASLWLAIASAQGLRGPLTAASVIALIYPLAASILAVLYYDARVRNEGFDLQLLAQSIGGDASRFERSQERPEMAPAPQPVPAGSARGGFAPPEGPASAS